MYPLDPLGSLRESVGSEESGRAFALELERLGSEGFSSIVPQGSIYSRIG